MAAPLRRFFAPITGVRQIHRWVKPTLSALYMRRKRLGPEPPRHRSSQLNWNPNAELYAFGQRLHEAFDGEALRTAFTHGSYVDTEVRQRQELGLADVQLRLVDNSQFIKEGEELMLAYIGAYLRHTHTHLPEEGIIAVRQFLVSDDILSHVALNIGTSDLILCKELPPSTSTLAKTMKAIVGALRASSDDARAELFVQDFVLTQLIGRDVNEMWTIDNPMGLLVDILRREERPLPESRIVRESGRNTLMAVFNVGVYSDRKLLGIGFGESVPIAEEMAAREALKVLFRTTQRNPPLPLGRDGRLLRLNINELNPSAQVWMTRLADEHAAATQNKLTTLRRQKKTSH